MKTRILFLLAAMLLGCASAFAQSNNSEPIKGDVNGDDLVNTTDARLILQFSAGKVGIDQIDFSVGDVNGDSKVNVADIVKAINDGKPQADIDDIMKIIFGK